MRLSKLANTLKKRINMGVRPADILTLLLKLSVPPTRAAMFADSIAEAFTRYGITTPLRIGHALAQLLHESARLRYTEEIASGAAYEGRIDLGNTERGDGRRFKGRGLIQLTGRHNYTRYTNYRRTAFREDVDFVENPQLVSELPHAADVFGWFWSVEKNLNRYADQGDTQLRLITRRINGGYNGYADRKSIFMKAMQHIRNLPSYNSDTKPL